MAAFHHFCFRASSARCRRKPGIGRRAAYYARLAQHRAAEENSRPPSSTAGGVVRNSLDEPVAGAAVTVIRIRSAAIRRSSTSWQRVTGDSGRFSVAATTKCGRRLGLEVHAPAS